MSKFLTEPLYNGRGKENQLRNLMYNAHDLACGCNQPRKHLLHLINPEKWLPTADGNEKTTGDQDGDHFDEGDLEKIFSEPEDVATG